MLVTTVFFLFVFVLDPESGLPTLLVTKKIRNEESLTPSFGAKRQLVVSLDQGIWKVLNVSHTTQK